MKRPFWLLFDENPYKSGPEKPGCHRCFYGRSLQNRYCRVGNERNPCFRDRSYVGEDVFTSEKYPFSERVAVVRRKPGEAREQDVMGDETRFRKNIFPATLALLNFFWLVQVMAGKNPEQSHPESREIFRLPENNPLNCRVGSCRGWPRLLR